MDIIITNRKEAQVVAQVVYTVLGGSYYGFDVLALGPCLHGIIFWALPLKLPLLNKAGLLNGQILAEVESVLIWADQS